MFAHRRKGMESVSPMHPSTRGKSTVKEVTDNKEKHS